MIVLGLLLILMAAGLVVFAVTAPSAALQTIEVTAAGVKVSASPLAMFLFGAGSVILLGLGLALINRGTRRRASSRKELRELRKGQAATATQPAPDSGRHSSDRDQAQKDSGTETSPEASTHTSADTSTDAGTDTGTETTPDPAR